MSLRKILFSIFFLLIIGAVVFNYIYKDHRNVELEKASFELSSLDFIDQYSASVEDANTKFLDQVIILHGALSDIDNNSILLDDQIRCYLLDSTNVLANNKTRIQIKGRCIGYDELLDEIKLDQCVVIKN